MFKNFFSRQDKIVTDLAVLKTPSKKTSKEECDKLDIFNRLRKVLPTCWTQGLGLAAIQLGIPLRAIYYKIKDKKVEMINPIIISQKDKFVFKNEGCLSFPNQRIDTYRFKEIITAFDYCKIIENDKVQEIKKSKFSADKVEALILQHECDHLWGFTIFDRKAISGTHQSKIPKLGRNSKCFCGNNRKLKHCCIEIYEAMRFDDTLQINE